MTRLRPDGSLVEELRGHELKLLLGAAGVCLSAAGAFTATSILLVPGIAAVLFAAGQLAAHWGTATAPMTAVSASARHISGEVSQKLTHGERTGFNGYATGRRLEDLAGEDTVFVVHDGEPPSRAEHWLPWRDTPPATQFAPVVVMDAERATEIEEGDTVEWELTPTTLDGVYVREYREESTV